MRRRRGHYLDWPAWFLLWSRLWRVLLCGAIATLMGATLVAVLPPLSTIAGMIAGALWGCAGASVGLWWFYERLARSR